MAVLLGAAGFVVIGLNDSHAKKFLSSALPQLLGRISYSLYLVHGTVLFASAALLQGRVSLRMMFAIYLAATLILSWSFFLLVEQPFMRVSRRMGKSKTEVVHEQLPVLVA